MRAKNACLIINPRAGENLAKLTDILTVLSAAGWDTDILIKEYGGQTLELAQDAGKQKYDLVIAYGGDGTLNQVVNGVVSANGKRSSVGILPGGTANVWANEVGVPSDPVKSALTLINSQARRVDVGHVEIMGLTFPSTVGETDTQGAPAMVNDGMSKAKKAKANVSSKGRHSFLLMAGLGIDAAVMGHVSKSLKYNIGALAVGVSAAKELSKQQPFPVEVYASGSSDEKERVWKGEAIQVVISNTRKYADVVEMTPNANIDDGMLDVCVITAVDTATTIGQVMSLLLRRRPDTITAEYFRSPRLLISVPASIALQLDGSAVKLKDYLSKKERAALRNAVDPSQVMVTYRFDTMPHFLSVAIPCSYNGALFESDRSSADAQDEKQADHKDEEKVQEPGDQSAINQPEEQEQSKEQEQEGRVEPLALPTSLQQGRKVTVIGASHNPDKRRPLYVIAGNTVKQSTGEVGLVAVRVTGKTTVLRRTGGAASLADIEALREGAEIVVEGKKSKRGVIAATQVVI